MEQHTSSSMVSDRRVLIPAIAWVMLTGLVVALLSIFVFKVAVGTVVTYGFIGLMVLSHFFMHGGHGSHGTHTNRADSQAGDGAKTDKYNSHAGHGGCH